MTSVYTYLGIQEGLHLPDLRNLLAQNIWPIPTISHCCSLVEFTDCFFWTLPVV